VVKRQQADLGACSAFAGPDLAPGAISVPAPKRLAARPRCLPIAVRVALATLGSNRRKTRECTEFIAAARDSARHF
jgi:hypothetical protein